MMAGIEVSITEVGPAPESVIRAWDGCLVVSVMGERIPGGGLDGRLVRLHEGRVETLAGGFKDPKGMAWDGQFLYVADMDTIWRVDHTGRRQVQVAPEAFPFKPEYLNDLVLLADGSLVVTDMGARSLATGPDGLWPVSSPEARSFPARGAVYRANQDGTVSTIVRGNAELPCPNGICIDPEGGLLLVDFFNGNLVSWREGVVRVLARGYRGADGVAIDRAGTIYVSQVTEGRVQRIFQRGAATEAFRTNAAAPADLFLDESKEGRTLLVPDTKAGRLIHVVLDSPFEESDGRIMFARAEIERGAHATGKSAPKVDFVRDLHLGAQAFRLQAMADGTVRIHAGDAAGALYGGLELAERVQFGMVVDTSGSAHRPHVMHRGIKFNLPLDLRTPSYSDNGDAAQLNIPEVWRRSFWQRYLDAMARARYNVLSLWNLHPFPSMVKVPEYPRVALADVWRTRTSMAGVKDDLGRDMLTPEMLAEHEVVHQLTIEQKIEFWRWVMQYAHDRGIQVYLFTWNVFTFGTDGHPGLSADLDNVETKNYFRASVREMLRTYPLLTGIGVTAGENMPLRDHSVKEKWLWEAYGEGVRDALREDPQRGFRLIHRYHWTNLGVILREWADFPGPFDLSYKYSVAHMYSIPNPPFLKPALADLPTGYRVWLTLRNDDIYSFRAGDPAYTREYIRNLPPSNVLGGFYMGSDGYTWGVDSLDRTVPEGGRPLVIEKHWYNFALWGRLSYDPTLPDERIQQWLSARHPTSDPQLLRETLQHATQVMPLITRFFWGDIDIKWFPEACLSKARIRGFYSVKDFVNGESMPGANVQSIRQWRESWVRKEKTAATTPEQIADQIEASAQTALAGVAGLRLQAESDNQLGATLADCESLARLGLYYTHKIRGAVHLAKYEVTGDPENRDSAIEELKRALAHWTNYATTRNGRYVPALYNRVGQVDLEALTSKVADDIELARTATPLSESAINDLKGTGSKTAN